MRRLYLARKGGAKTEVLGFVDGGYHRVLDALRRRLEAAGVEVMTGCPVSRVAREDGRLEVTASRGTRSFDQVVSTLPAGATARLCPELGEDMWARLGDVIYQGILCASVLLDRPLAGHYLTYLTDAGLPFTAVIEMSALTGTERFGGRTLVYLPRYATQSDPYWDLGDEEIEQRFIAGLSSIYPSFTSASVTGFRLARVRSVMAVPTIGYGAIAPPVRTGVDGFHIANSAQITDGTLNVDATLGVVERALPQLLSHQSVLHVRSAA
jgi:protoporphyrinogen oxidase